jgi:hypothetical protein
MSKRLLTAAAAVLMLAAFASTATAAPTPDYTVTCTAGVAGQTIVTWNHAKLQSVTFDWVTSGGTSTQTVPVFSAHPPRGSILTSTPGFATSVIVTFHRTSGIDDRVPSQNCA